MGNSIIINFVAFTHKCMCGTLFKADKYLAKCPKKCDGLVRSFKDETQFGNGATTSKIYGSGWSSSWRR